MNSPEFKAFIKEHSSLFWYIREDAKENISFNLLVETILQYGDIPDVKRLFELIGINQASAIFFEQISKRRCNYQPRTIHYFKTYFEKNVSLCTD